MKKEKELKLKKEEGFSLVEIIVLVLLIILIIGVIAFLFRNNQQNQQVEENAEDINNIEEQREEISKLGQMYIEVIDYIMKQDGELQSNTKFMAIDFTNFRRPLTEEESIEAKKEMQSGIRDFVSAEAEEEWKRMMKSKPIDEKVKQEILNYCKNTYSLEIKEATLEELKKQGLVTENGIEEGVIIYIERLPEKIEENNAKICLTKYRGPLGAYFIEYQMKYTNNTWQLKSLSEAIS